MFCNNIVLPVPEGPKITARIGSLPHCKYLDCLESYSFTLNGFIVGVVIIIIRIHRTYSHNNQMEPVVSFGMTLPPSELFLGVFVS